MFSTDDNQSIKLKNISLHRIRSFKCENNITLGVSDCYCLIYSDQSLILYNIDGPVCHVSWQRDRFDCIQQIRWSSYFRSFLIMTAENFFLFTLSNPQLYELKIQTLNMQYFACDWIDLWLISRSIHTKQQYFYHRNLSNWKQNYQPNHYSLSQFGLHQADLICAIECDLRGAFLALLIAEGNSIPTGNVSRARRLVIVDRLNLTSIHTIYFQKPNSLYWIISSFIPWNHSQQGWLIAQSFDRQLTYLDHQNPSETISLNYHDEIRNIAVSTNGQYLFIRTSNSIDIYPID